MESPPNGVGKVKAHDDEIKNLGIHQIIHLSSNPVIIQSIKALSALHRDFNLNRNGYLPAVRFPA
jgi:hypothetical protein